MQSLYDVIWNYFHTYIFSTADDGIMKYTRFTLFNLTDVQLGDYLSTLCTWIILALIILFFVNVTIWLFKWFGGLFKW